MTQDEKHALIAEKIAGWTEVVIVPDPDSGHAWDHAMGTPPNSRVFVRVPNYSSDLNLCARAEARIAEMGDHAKQIYLDIRADAAGYDWEFANASAAARVDAMVALIQSIGSGQ